MALEKKNCSCSIVEDIISLRKEIDSFVNGEQNILAFFSNGNCYNIWHTSFGAELSS